MSIYVNGVTFEKSRDGSYRTPSASGYDVLSSGNTVAKKISRSLAKIQVPYSYVGPDGGTQQGTDTVHFVMTGEVPLNAAHRAARDAALDRAQSVLLILITQVGFAAMEKRLMGGLDLCADGSTWGA